MSDLIQTLPDSVIKQIAAGEVISSPVAVVRELVENALDANAQRIVISLDAELSCVQVTDDGDGMALEDLRCCALPHTTSKIRSFRDLEKLTTLGFRGEALHSMTQVAQLEVFSRPRHGETTVGYGIQFGQNGEVIQEKPIAIAPGTIVTVKHLFGAFPVRRQALPKASQALKSIQTLIYEMALCYPHLTWQGYHIDALRARSGDLRSWLHLSPTQTPQHIFPQIFPKFHHSDFQSVSRTIDTPETETKSRLELVVGLPDRISRHQGDWIKTALNGRCVDLPQLQQTIISTLLKTLPRGRHPICWLHLHTDPSLIDWNRHPAKAQIYLRHLKYWQEQTVNLLNEVLRLNPDRVPETVHNRRVGQLIKAEEAKGTYTVTKKEEGELSLFPLKAIAQVHQTYIVAEHPTGMWLIEQHIAHERIIYEQLQEQWEIVSQEPPLIVNGWSESQQEQLDRLGLEIDEFGAETYAIRSVPKILQHREDLTEAILELSLGGDLETAQVATACRSAIRNGTPLSIPQMQSILDDWKRTNHPHTCPHGRPIYLSLTETSLAKFFRRHWVIGKSHGI